MSTVMLLAGIATLVFAVKNVALFYLGSVVTGYRSKSVMRMMAIDTLVFVIGGVALIVGRP